MTSATYLIEVRDDGMTAVGRIDHVTRTVYADFGDGNGSGEMWIRLNGRIVDVSVQDEDAAKITALAGLIAGAAS